VGLAECLRREQLRPSAYANSADFRFHVWEFFSSEACRFLFTAVLLLPFCALAAVGTSTEIQCAGRRTSEGHRRLSSCALPRARRSWPNTPSPPMFLLVFKKGDIARGQYPQASGDGRYAVGCDFINVRHWSDGSVKIAGVLPDRFRRRSRPRASPRTSSTVAWRRHPRGSHPHSSYGAQIALNANGFPDPLGFGVQSHRQLAGETRGRRQQRRGRRLQRRARRKGVIAS